MIARFTLLSIMLGLLITAGCTTGAGVDVDDQPGGGDSTLTAEQMAGIEAAIETASALAAAASGASPTADLESFVAQFGDDGPDCPSIDSSIQPGRFSVTLDFGDGCSPALYPDSTLSGSVGGTIDRGASAVELTFGGFTVDDQTIDGTFAGGFAREEDIVSFDVAVDLTLTDAGSIAGDMVVAVDRSTGVITIAAAVVTVTDVSGTAFEMLHSNVTIDPVSNGNFIPQSGTVTFDADNPDPGPDTVIVAVEFTVDTPADGTVLVSIASGQQVSYTPGG